MSSWEAIYGELRARFVRQAREWLDEANRLADGLDRDPEDAASLDRLSVVFHRIAGSAGTYGYPRVSELADEGEGACITLTRAGTPPTREDVALLRRLAEAIGVELPGDAQYRDR